MQTWTDMVKDVKAQADHAQKEMKGNAPWIEVVKKQKGTLVDRMEMMNTTFEEEAKRKACALHVHVWLVWLKREAHKKMPRISERRLGHQIFHLLQRGGWTR